MLTFTSPKVFKAIFKGIFNGVLNSAHSIVMNKRNPPVFGPGFSQVPGGDAYLNRTVLSWHWYCLPAGNTPGDLNVPYDENMRKLCDEIWGPKTFRDYSLD